MKYSAALDFVLSRTDYERWPGHAYASRFDLRRMEDLLHRLGNPHLQAKTVHIAGSKGKGSTAAMIAAGLRAAGYKTGLYTSPHLVTILERIRVNGKLIHKSELAGAVARILPHAEEMDRERTYGELTTFELLTAAAFVHFEQTAVDFQVMETGLGGRLDATNVVAPQVCVITSVSLDHQEVLGNTVELIAAEKAGIIKPGIPVVCAPQVKGAFAVIQQACLEKKAQLIAVGRDISWGKTASDLSGQSLEVKGRNATYHLTIPLLGAYQLHNAAAATAALEILGIPGKSIEAGLALTDWPGRLQVLRRRPMLVVDGAHSIDSAKNLRCALKQYFDFDHLILIIGISADKDMAGIVAELAPLADIVIATRSRHPRASVPQVIADEFVRLGIKTEVAENAALAVAKARQIAKRKSLICATGSLFLVGEVIEFVKGLRPEIYHQRLNK